MYLDPGLGGLFIQVFLAMAVFGGALLFSFKRKFSKKDDVRRNAKDDIEDDAIDTLKEE